MNRRFSRAALLRGLGAVAGLGVLPACAAATPTSVPAKPAEKPAAAPTAAPAAPPKPAEATKPAAAPKPAEPTKPAAAAEPTKPAPAAAQPAPAKVGKMSLWISEGGEDAAKHLREVTIPAWQKAQPGVSMEAEFLNWQRYNERFLTAYASGTMADIFQAPPESTPELSRLNQARPLDDLVKGAKNVKWEDHLKGALDQFIFNGKTYAVPFRMQTRGWTYWKSALKEKGLEPAKTWDDVIKLSSQLTIKEGNRVVRPGFSEWPGSQFFMDSIWQIGAEMLTPDGRAAAFATPEGERALQYMIDAWKGSYPNPQEQLEKSPVPLFTQKRFAMAFGGQWHYDQVKQYAPNQVEDLDIVPWSVKGPGDKGKQISVNYASGWAISSQAKDPDTAFSFIDFFNAKDNALPFMKVFGQFPTARQLIEDPYYKNDPRLQNYWQLAQTSRATPAWPQVIELYNRLRDGLLEAWFGRMKPMEALQKIAKEWEPALQKEPGRP